MGVLLAAEDGWLAVVLAGLALYLGLLLRHAARPGIAGLALAWIASSLLALIDDLNMPLSGLPLTLVIWHGALLVVWRYYAPRSPELATDAGAMAHPATRGERWVVISGSRRRWRGLERDAAGFGGDETLAWASGKMKRSGERSDCG